MEFVASSFFLLILLSFFPFFLLSFPPYIPVLSAFFETQFLVTSYVGGRAALYSSGKTIISEVTYLLENQTAELCIITY